LLRRGAAQADRAVLIADAQHAGRGRRGQAWHSPPRANLYLSMHARLHRTPQALAGLSLVVGLATAEALHGLGHREVQVKWPNDLLARGRKLGGVLIELAGDAALIGLGLNLRMPPDAATAIDQPWIDLATLGGDESRACVAAAVLSAWLDALDLFASEGLAPFLARWETHDALAEREVRVLAGSEQWLGRACGIAADGGLRVRLAHGERVFHSADVSLRAA
jgi:BirA family biotin operon repressor/biotin-[acetyl-CoA-carboxylase] ligase